MLSSVNILVVDHTNTIWNKEVPIKVGVFVRCLLHNRLPITYNLTRRHVLHPNVYLSAAMGGYDMMEDIDHLFLSYDFFEKI
jgi:hypothetical protein